MGTVLREVKQMMLDYQDVHKSRRRRFTFGFNGLEKLPGLNRKLADQEQHLQTWLSRLTIGGIGRLEITCGRILKILNDQNGNKEPEAS